MSQLTTQSKPSPPLAREILLVFGVSMLILPLVFGLSATGNLSFIESKLYIYGTSLEFLSVGFLPLLLALRDRDRRDFYGVGLTGATKSIILGAALVAVRGLFRYVAGSPPFEVGLVAFSQSLAQPFPGNLFFSFITVFSYGPLEVFYITFLVAKLDLAFHSAQGTVLTKGVFSGVLLWALIHLNSAVFFGFTFAAAQVVSNFIYGILLMMVFKYSKCSIGTMSSFTITNLFQ